MINATKAVVKNAHYYRTTVLSLSYGTKFRLNILKWDWRFSKTDILL